MNQSVARIRRALALTIASLGLLSGCALDTRRHVNQMIVGFDVSCPAKARLLSYAKSVYGAQRALPLGSRLRVYTFGHGCDLVYNGERIAGRDAFNRCVGTSLAKPPAELLTPGTETDRLFERLAADAASSRAPCLVLVATDGGMEDQRPEAMSRLRSAVQRLRASSNLQAVVLIGVQPQYRTLWEQWLRPLGSKSLVHGDNDADGIARELLGRGGNQ